MLTDKKPIEPKFLTSNFPVLMSNLIDRYLKQKGITREVFANNCALDRKTINNMKNGGPLTKRSILRVCVAMDLSLEETEKTLHSAGFEFNSNNNTDIAYRFLIENRVDRYNFDEKIFELNKKITSLYKMDKIKPLYLTSKEDDGAEK